MHLSFALALSSLVLTLTQSFTLNQKQSIGKSKQLAMSNANEKEEGIFLLSNMDQISIDGPKRLILASQSPRRREILDMIGLKDKYSVIPSPLDEGKLQIKLSKMNMSPQDYTKVLAEEKANALAEHLVSMDYSDDDNCETTFILGSDTIVDLGGKILEKPTSSENAIEMLQSLSNNWHEVHTGVALYRIQHQKSQTFKQVDCVTSYTDTSKVKFSSLSMRDIEAYVKTGEPMDKAGSYGIQVSAMCYQFTKIIGFELIFSYFILSYTKGIGGQFVEEMIGDFFTIMGLPMNSLSREISKALKSDT